MGRLALIVLLAAGCTLTRTYDASGQILEENLSPGIYRAETPAEGRQHVQGLGVVIYKGGGVLGYYSADTSRLGPCGLVIITDHPERVNPALLKPC